MEPFLGICIDITKSCKKFFSFLLGCCSLNDSYICFRARFSEKLLDKKDEKSFAGIKKSVPLQSQTGEGV